MWNKTRTKLVVAGLCFLGLAIVISAQSAIPKDDQSRIVLPLELVAGQPATLAVLAANGHVVAGVNVVLSNGQVVTTDESGRAHFLGPPDTGPMFARIVGTDVREAADVLAQTSNSNDVQLTRMPKLASLRNYLAIGGHGFQGDADRNSVKVGEKAVLVLASSPVELIAMLPVNSPVGSVNLRIIEGKTEMAAPLALVDVVSLGPPNVPIRRGQKARLVLRVEGTAEPVNLEIKNLSPQFIQFPHGNDAVIRTTGGADNAAVVQLKGVGAGSFSFTASLEDSSKIDGEVARAFLEASQKMAGSNTAKRIQVLMNELNQSDMETPRVLEQIHQISGLESSLDFQALIRAASRAVEGE